MLFHTCNHKICQSMSPTAAIIIIGNEILSGRTQDTNTQFIAKRLGTLGIRLTTAIVIPDDNDTIMHTVNDLRKKNTYVFTTGGIGPTHDDITSKAIAYAFNRPFEIEKKAYEILLNYYGEEDFSLSRQRMTYMPRGANLITNPVSAAPAFFIENVYVLPGFPKIMQEMFKLLEPELNKSTPIISKTIHCYLPESMIAEGLENAQNNYPQLEIGSYPFYQSEKHFGTNLVVKGTNEKLIENCILEISQIIKDKGADPLEGETNQHHKKT